LIEKILKKENFGETQAAEIMKQILSGIAYLHSVGIIHGCISPEKILFLGRNNRSENKLKITDFGVTKQRSSF